MSKNVERVAATACRTVLAFALAGAGAAKLTKQRQMLDSAEYLGYTPQAFQAIGALEIAAAAGLFLGRRKPRLGAASALGASAVLGGVVVEHVRHGDGPEAFGPPALLGALALTTARNLTASNG